MKPGDWWPDQQTKPTGRLPHTREKPSVNPRFWNVAESHPGGFTWLSEAPPALATETLSMAMVTAEPSPAEKKENLSSLPCRRFCAAQ